MSAFRHFSKKSLSGVPSDGLASVLDGAAQVLLSVNQGQSLGMALKQFFYQYALASRGAIQSLVNKALRGQGAAHYLLKALLSKSPPSYISALLQCALVLLLETQPSYQVFTVVDQAVLAVSKRKQFAHLKKLVNAVLRRFLREQTEWKARLATDGVAHWNYPAWWIEKVQQAYPAQWQSILEAGNQQGPLTLRVNQRQICVAQYLQVLVQQGLEAIQTGACALSLKRSVPVERIPGFAQGWVSVQDAGAQLAVEQLNVHDGLSVLDACAAPGGKTGHILEFADVELVALESDEQRAQRIFENLQRLHLHAKVCIGDASQPMAWFDGVAFDRILADVPCSGSGVVRRHPDIRWLRRKTDFDQFVLLQRRILLALWPLLKPKGELLYVTCSIFPEEGEQQAQWFLAQCADAMRLPSVGQILPCAFDGQAKDHDGFFYARFLKQ